MKRILIVGIQAVWPMALAFGQVVNPVTIYQDTDIALHNTNVYYAPFAPPGDSDTRANLCAISEILRDPDGVGNSTDRYWPIVWDARNHKFDSLLAWAPCWDSVHGKWDTLGGPALNSDGNPNIDADTVVWERLFTANFKSDGVQSDLIAGGNAGDRVIVSKNEDVDFRATGRVILKSGFHAEPGCFLHAYTAPRHGPVAFSDEFDSDFSKWTVTNGAGGNSVEGANCSSPANATLVTDPDAHDGHAVRIDMVEDTCHCYVQNWNSGISISHGDTTPGCTDVSTSTRDSFDFTTADFLSCPFPFLSSDTPAVPAWQHAPYGIYEVREKIPPFKHKMNNFGDGQSDEWNFDETNHGNMSLLGPGATQRFKYGPYKGKFSYDTTESAFVFRSRPANFANWNNPTGIIINNFLYDVDFVIDTAKKDTFLVATATTLGEGGFPSSLTSSGDSVTFYYEMNSGHASDSNLYWSIDSSGTYFTGPYGVSNQGDTLYFTKQFQPTSITFFDSTIFQSVTLNCHWDHNTRKVIFTSFPSDMSFHQGHGFGFTMNYGPHYPGPAVGVDTGSFYGKYHTFTMELLPHEARFLIDGHVLRRTPDRLIPPGYQQLNFTFPRAPMNIRIAEFEMDGLGTDYDNEKADFERRYGVGGTASDYVDYFKLWDVPSDVIIPSFPH